MIKVCMQPVLAFPVLWRGKIMNTIIYIVGLVVIIGIVLSYFGLR